MPGYQNQNTATASGTTQPPKDRVRIKTTSGAFAPVTAPSNEFAELVANGIRRKTSL
jgi:hypothetical protein